MKEKWIFYLQLQKDLPLNYFSLDQKFKNYSKSLIPVSIGALSEITASEHNLHVVIILKSVKELEYFNKRVKKILKLLMRTNKINLYIASSFTSISDPGIMRKGYYNFMKLPVSYNYLCGSVSKSVDLKESKSLLWPGGSKSRFELAG